MNSNLFSGYYLDERVQDLDAWDCDEAARAVFEHLRERYRDERRLLETYNEDDLLEAWIDEVLDTLGYDGLQETNLPEGGGFIDRVLFGSAEERRDAAAMRADGRLDGTYGRAATILEAKQWDADFAARFSEDRSYRDASHQIKYYLERTPESVA